MRRTLVRGGIVVGAVALAMLLLGGALGRPAPTTPAAATPPEQTVVDRLEQSIAQAQDRLRRVPGDWLTWAALGMSYLEHARITTDPTYYPKAEAASVNASADSIASACSAWERTYSPRSFHADESARTPVPQVTANSATWSSASSRT